jgi:hypothetical protein
MGANTRVTFTCVLVTGNTAASWSSPAVTAASGGMTLLSTTAITAIASIPIASIDQTYTDLVIEIENAATSATAATLQLGFNSAAGTPYMSNMVHGGVAYGYNGKALMWITTPTVTSVTNVNNISVRITIPRYASAAGYKLATFYSAFMDSATGALQGTSGGGGSSNQTAITSIQLAPDTGTWTAQGNVYIYGVK